MLFYYEFENNPLQAVLYELHQNHVIRGSGVQASVKRQTYFVMIDTRQSTVFGLVVPHSWLM